MSDLNDPRVFFAAERTLLAWNRTGLTRMAFGLVLARFGLFQRVLKTLKPAEIPARYCTWSGIALTAYLFSGL